MIDCALVDRDSSQIDCKPPENAGAGSDDRTRKRARGEAPEDYAKRDAFKAVRGTRERLQSAPTASITTHFFSIVYYALINVTRELALKPIYTNAPRVYVFGPHAAGDDELRARIELYDRGVDPELFVNLRNPLCWIPYNEQYFVCPSVGEVMVSSTSQLSGMQSEGKIRVSISGKRRYRADVVLEACERELAVPGISADHKDFTQPLNDTINNLRWAEASVQGYNRRRWKRESLKIEYPDGIILPKHYSGLSTTTSGLYQTGCKSYWMRLLPRQTSSRCTLNYNGSAYYLPRVIMECLLNRQLLPGEEVDHIDGCPMLDSVSNYQVIPSQANQDKAVIQLCTSAQEDGCAVVWGGCSIASATLCISQGNISKCLCHERKQAGGYSWRDSTVEEVEHFFRAMDALEDLPAAVASLASHPRHGELVRALELRREREAALARLGLCDPPVGWVRGTDGCSGLSFYHREETGECRWRNPTLTRLGL